jgi:hypothetical protein
VRLLEVLGLQVTSERIWFRDLPHTEYCVSWDFTVDFLGELPPRDMEGFSSLKASDADFTTPTAEASALMANILLALRRGRSAWAWQDLSPEVIEGGVKDGAAWLKFLAQHREEAARREQSLEQANRRAARSASEAHARQIIAVLPRLIDRARATGVGSLTIGVDDFKSCHPGILCSDIGLPCTKDDVLEPDSPIGLVIKECELRGWKNQFSFPSYTRENGPYLQIFV